MHCGVSFEMELNSTSDSNTGGSDSMLFEGGLDNGSKLSIANTSFRIASGITLTVSSNGFIFFADLDAFISSRDLCVNL